MTESNRVEQFESTIGKGKDSSFEEFRREARTHTWTTPGRCTSYGKSSKKPTPKWMRTRWCARRLGISGCTRAVRLRQSRGETLGPPRCSWANLQGRHGSFRSGNRGGRRRPRGQIFHSCPHVDALKELGATPAEITHFCRNILSACDFGICHPFKKVKIEFPTTVADSTGHGCQMIIRQAQERGVTISFGCRSVSFWGQSGLGIGCDYRKKKPLADLSDIPSPANLAIGNRNQRNFLAFQV